MAQSSKAPITRKGSKYIVFTRLDVAQTDHCTLFTFVRYRGKKKKKMQYVCVYIYILVHNFLYAKNIKNQATKSYNIINRHLYPRGITEHLVHLDPFLDHHLCSSKEILERNEGPHMSNYLETMA